MINIKLTFTNGNTVTFTEPNMDIAEYKVLVLMDTVPGQIQEVEYNEEELAMRKYELTSETMTLDGVTLHRIRALTNFADVTAGDLGGWIEKEENLSQDGDAWVGGVAKVYGSARVCENAMVYENARVYENAQVCGSARISENAMVFGNARVCESAGVYSEAWVAGNAIVAGNARVCDYAGVGGDARVGGHDRIGGYATVCGNAANAAEYGEDPVYAAARRMAKEAQAAEPEDCCTLLEEE